MIQAQGITKRYGELTVLDGLCLAVEPGELVSILGESGSGKSTLLRIIAGLEEADAGRLLLGGKPPAPEPGKRGVSMTFQEPALWNHMTVEDNILYGCPLRGRQQRREQAALLAGRLGIGELLKRYPYEISGGQAKRVALARAIACRKPVLLLDEPFSNLDERIKGIAMDAVRQFCAEMTVLLVTHSREEADCLSKKRYHLERGRLYG